jgi:hypothetical protein
LNNWIHHSSIIIVSTILNGGYWTYMELTYDNGNKSDNWCRSHTPVPPELLKDEYYQMSASDSRNYIVLTDAITFKGFWPENKCHYFICE